MFEMIYTFYFWYLSIFKTKYFQTFSSSILVGDVSLDSFSIKVYWTVSTTDNASIVFVKLQRNYCIKLSKFNNADHNNLKKKRSGFVIIAFA